MKVLSIFGSPRKKSASNAIAEAFNREAEANGAEVVRYDLNSMNYKGCQGCHGCKTGHETCVLKDDLSQVYDDLHEADAVVISSPIYFGDVTAQLKGFYDRLYSTITPEILTTGVAKSRLPEGKKSLLVFTQGAPEDVHEEIAPRYDGYFAISGFSDHRIIRDCNRVDYTDDTPAEDAIATAKTAARDFMSI